MRSTVGSEIRSYQNSVATTGVPRVIRETHRHLVPALQEHGIDLLPVATSERSETEPRDPIPYVASDPIFEGTFVGPEDVDCLLLLHPSSTIDFARISAVRHRTHLPVIAMINDLLPLSRPDWFRPRAERTYRVLVQQIFHVADHLVVPSHQVADDLVTLKWRTRPQVHVFPLGSSFPLRPARSRAEGTIELLYVSTLAPRKGHDRLLDAFDILSKQGVDIRLTLVGQAGWNIDALLDRLRNHPLFGQTLFWESNADDARVASLLETSSVAVVPAEAEGFGFFVEEALSAGLVVVASDIPVFRERPHRNLVYFDGSSTHLAESILEAAKRNPEPVAPGELRTMRDFSSDLCDLVIGVVRENGDPVLR